MIHEFRYSGCVTVDRTNERSSWIIRFMNFWQQIRGWCFTFSSRKDFANFRDICSASLKLLITALIVSVFNYVGSILLIIASITSIFTTASPLATLVMIMSSFCCRLFSASLSDLIKVSLGISFTNKFFIS